MAFRLSVFVSLRASSSGKNATLTKLLVALLRFGSCLYRSVINDTCRRAARFTMGRYHYDSHVSDICLLSYNGRLEHRRWKSRLTMFDKIQFGLVAIPLPEFIVLPERPRPGHPHQFQRIYCTTDAYKYSFFPFAIKQWNALPTSTACQSTLPLCQGRVSSLSP